MSDILSTAGAVLSKTRFAWEIPSTLRERHTPGLTLQAQIIMNKKTHSTDDVSGSRPGDYAHGHNKTGKGPQTPLHQNQRTPGSRSDRDDHLGSDNQSRRRKTGPEHGG